MNLLSRMFTGLASALVGLATVQAEVVTYTLDPERSSISLTGSASGITLQEQAAGSLTTSYTGTLVADVTASQIQFVGGSRVVARELNSWQPGPNGAEGSAPASYGAKGSSGFGFFAVTATAASRRLLFDVSGPPLSLTGGAFNATSLLVQFVDTNNCALDYRVSGALNATGTRVLSGLATNLVAGTSSITLADGIETLRLSIAATFVLDLLVPGDTTLNLTGELVATRSAGEEPPVIDVTPPAPGGTSMNLSWPANYKLQRATTLLPPDWADVAGDSPLTIPFVGPGEFFRIVPK